ncbi:MAG: tetratricopeptide repeat protein [Deltaproteobacteria bacterium]|nr:tetratricopeptide repeat protein [Deltaproteobacteria bacterium]
MARVWRPLLGLVMAWVWSGCDSATFDAGTQFSSGRRAFLAKKYDEALPYFQKVAEDKPGYVYEAYNFRQSVWSYLGRSQYLTGKYDEARQALERALAGSRDEHLARIFIGLALTRLNNDTRGVTEIEDGLKSLEGWIDYENARNPSHTMWDPRREIRNEIKRNLTAVGSQNYDRQRLIESVEWIGWAMEEEIEKVRRDQTRS